MNANAVYLLSLLLGQMLPPFVDFINKNVLSSKIRFYLSMLICGSVGIVVNYNNIQHGDIEQILTTALLVWGSSQVAYKQYYENSTWQHKIRGMILDDKIKQPTEITP